MASIGTLGGADFNPHFQVGLDVAGRRCLVIGGGGEALDKTLRLLDAGARVVLVAPELCTGVADLAGGRRHGWRGGRVARALCTGWADLAAAGRIDWRRRRYRSDDLRGACLIINTVRSDPALCERVFTAAQRSRIPINTYDLPQYSTLAMAALVTCGHLRISISTSNAAPAVASRLRRDLTDLLAADSGLAEYLDTLGRIRVLAKQRVGDPGERRSLLRGLADGLRLRGAVELPADWRRQLASVEEQLRQRPQPGRGARNP